MSVNINVAKRLAKKMKGSCLSESFKDELSPLMWECSEKHSWKANYYVVKKGFWCHICFGRKKFKPKNNSALNKRVADQENVKEKKIRLEKEKEKTEKIGLAKKYAISRGGVCLSNEFISYKDKLTFKCSDQSHPIWKANFYNAVILEHWCHLCGIKTIAEKNKNKTALDIAKKYAINRKGECLSDEYINNKENLLWKCHSSSHQPWLANFHNVIDNKKWCPECAEKNRRTENRIRLFFETHFKERFPCKRPNWNISTLTGYRLELDGYCEKFNLAFEFDGFHHNTIVSPNEPGSILKLIKIKYNDYVKGKNCKKANITLIRVPEDTKIQYDFFGLLKHVLKCCLEHGLQMTYSFSEIRKMKKKFDAM